MNKARKASHLVKKAKICLCSYSNPYMARNNCEIMNRIAIQSVVCFFIFFYASVCAAGTFFSARAKQIYSYFNGFITLCFSYRLSHRRASTVAVYIKLFFKFITLHILKEIVM